MPNESSKALLIVGNQSIKDDAANVDYATLKDFISDVVDLEILDSLENADLDTLKPYRLVFLAISSSQYAGNLNFIASLYEFVLCGGSLFCISDGTDMHDSHELCAVIGAKFLEKKPLAYLEFSPSEQHHPLNAAAAAFIMDEYAYRFEWSIYSHCSKVLQHTYGAVSFPTMWTTLFGEGKTASLTIRLSNDTLRMFELRTLLYNAVLWLCDKDLVSESLV